MRIKAPEAVYYLHIDLDGKEPKPIEEIRAVLSEFNTDVDYVFIKPSFQGMHMIIKLTNPVDPMHVPLIEALLGSDIIRSCLVYWRYENDLFLDVFFDHKYQPEIKDKRKWRCSDVVKFMRWKCPGFIRMLRIYGKEPCDLV